MEQLITVMVEQGITAVLAIVFIITYFGDKKDSKEYRITQLEHEKDLAIIMRDSTRIMDDLKVVTDTSVEIHKDLDSRVRSIDEKLNSLIESSNHYETISAITEVRQLLSDFIEDMGM